LQDVNLLMKKKEAILITLVILGSSVLITFPTYATPTASIETLIADEINQESLVQIVTNLMQGDVGPTGNRIYNPRTQGTPNGDLAIATVVDYFESWGLDRVEIFTNPTALTNRWYLKTWEITSPQYTFLPEGNWACRNSPANDVTGDLIYVGSGTSASDYEGLDVEGKIVLCDGTARTAYTRAVTERGAIGLVKIAPRGSYYPDTGYYDHPYSSEVTGIQNINYDAANTAPAISISWDDGANLKELLVTQDVMVNMMVDAEIIPTSYSKSVIATINGLIPDDKYFILYGHLDSDSYGPGCDDSASGVAAFMEIARAIQTLINEGTIPRPMYSIKFFAIGSELSDSRAYLQSLTEEQLALIIGGCNFDQAGLGVEHNAQNIEGTDLAICQELLLVCKDLKEEYEGTYWESDNFQFIPYLGGTDHVRFLDFDIPTTYIWTDWTYRAETNPPEWGGDTVWIAGNPYYHTSGDTLENTVLREPFNMPLISRMVALLTVRCVDFYQVTGFLPPLSTDRTYKAGSTIPVKLQLIDSQGNYITDAVVELYVDDMLVGQFRYDLTSDQYIYNLRTKGLTGSITLEAKLSNGVAISTIVITLK